MTDDIKTEFQYVLKNPFEYSESGNITQSKFITLKAPNSKTLNECSALKQAFFRAMNEQSTDVKADSNAESNIEGQDVMTLLAMSNTVQLPEVMEVAKKLFQSPGIASVDGEKKLTNELLGRISVDDFEDMLGEYLVNFTLASSLMRMKSKSSKASQT